jgi:hypothetical protein
MGFPLNHKTKTWFHKICFLNATCTATFRYKNQQGSVYDYHTLLEDMVGAAHVESSCAPEA